MRGDSGDMSGGEGGAAGQFVPADAPIAIGKIELVTGSAIVVRASDSLVHLKVNDPVFRGDVIETSADGQVCIRFLDNTTFNLSNNARMVLKEFPGEGISGPALFDIGRGDFAFVSGEMAKAGRLEIETPFASIRGRMRVGGIGTLSLVSLLLTAMEQAEARPPEPTFDDGRIPVDYAAEPHGTFILDTKGAISRRIVVDDPGVTWALRLNSSSEVSVSQVSNSPAQMIQLQAIQQSVLHTYSVGLQAMQGPTFNAPSGSATNPAFEIPTAGARPINFTQPDSSGPSQNSNSGPQELHPIAIPRAARRSSLPYHPRNRRLRRQRYRTFSFRLHRCPSFT